MALDEYRSGIVTKVNIFHGRVKKDVDHVTKST